MATKPTKHQQTNSRPQFADPEYIGRIFLIRNIFLFEKKIVLVRFEHRNFAVPRRIRYHQANFAIGNTIIEIIMKQGTPGVQ